MKAGATNRRRVRAFCEQFAERAFRRPLTDAQKKAFIELQFKNAKDEQTAVKQIVALVLKSPRFLYPECQALDVTFDIASRLSFTLWDSIPDKELLAAAERGSCVLRKKSPRTPIAC